MISQTTNGYGASALPPSRHSSQFQHDLVALLPDLERYSRSVCRGRGIAQDMAQDTLESAWQAQDRFGTAVGTVRSRIARGRDALLSILADVESDPRRSYAHTAIPSFAGNPLACPA